MNLNMVKRDDKPHLSLESYLIKRDIGFFRNTPGIK